MMKRTALFCLAITFCSFHAFSERSALISADDGWNLFSRFDLKFTEIDEDEALMGALYAGGFLNDHVVLGIGGSMLASAVETTSPMLKDISDSDFWYAGLYTGILLNPENVVSASLDLLAGAGNLTVRYSGGVGHESSSLIVLEPGLSLRLNILETMVLGVSGSYRVIEASDIDQLNDSDLSGITGSIFLQFTEF